MVVTQLPTKGIRQFVGDEDSSAGFPVILFTRAACACYYDVRHGSTQSWRVMRSVRVWRVLAVHQRADIPRTYVTLSPRSAARFSRPVLDVRSLQEAAPPRLATYRLLCSARASQPPPLRARRMGDESYSKRYAPRVFLSNTTCGRVRVARPSPRAGRAGVAAPSAAVAAHGRLFKLRETSRPDTRQNGMMMRRQFCILSAYLGTTRKLTHQLAWSVLGVCQLYSTTFLEPF